MTEERRVVVVTAGFGLWEHGRHVISARWTDVVRVRSVGAEAGLATTATLVITLRGGTEIRLHDQLAGWSTFLVAIQSALPGITPAVASLAADEQVVLFERNTRR